MDTRTKQVLTHHTNRSTPRSIEVAQGGGEKHETLLPRIPRAENTHFSHQKHLEIPAQGFYPVLIGTSLQSCAHTFVNGGLMRDVY